jgi:tRNA A-37 threonylcarbamoyl transferase component Bud32
MTLSGERPLFLANFKSVYLRKFNEKEFVSIEKSKSTDLIIKQNLREKNTGGSYEIEKNVYYRIASLNNINLPKLHASDSRKKTLYLQNIKGSNIMDLCNNEIQISDQEKVNIVLQVINGIQGLHSRGVAHLDLNGKNIILNKDNYHVTLIDFDGAGINSTGNDISAIDSYIVNYKIMFVSKEDILNRRQSCIVFTKPPEVRVEQPSIDGEKADLYGMSSLLTGIYFGYNYLRQAVEIDNYGFQIVNRNKLYKNIEIRTNQDKLIKDLIYTNYGKLPEQRYLKFTYIKEIFKSMLH